MHPGSKRKDPAKNKIGQRVKIWKKKGKKKKNNWQVKDIRCKSSGI